MRLLFEHRHYVRMAWIIAKLYDEDERLSIAKHFAGGLADTNRNFDRDRFISAAMGNPINGRDRR